MKIKSQKSKVGKKYLLVLAVLLCLIRPAVVFAQKRTFPQQTVAATNTIQPLVSTTFNGSISSSVGPQTVTVASTSGMNVSDVLNLSIGTVRTEFARVLSVPSGTTVKIQQLNGINLGPGLAAHTSGDFIATCQNVRSVYVQRVANDTNILYIGDSTLNPGASPPLGIIASIVGVAAATQPTEFSDPAFGHAVDLCSYWVYGTINTVYNISTTIN